MNNGDPSLLFPVAAMGSSSHGARLGDEVVGCGLLELSKSADPVPRDLVLGVRSIARTPSLYQMEEIAWVLRSSPSGKKIGFVEARKLKG